MSLLLLFPSGGGAPSAITGTGAVTEAGADTSAASGGVLVAGTAGISESVADAAAASGDVVVQGSSAAAESGQDTGAASGAVSVQGALAVSEVGQDSAEALGAVLVQCSASATETGEDVAAAFGGGAASVITGSAALTESSEDTASGEGSSGEVAPSNRPGFEMGGRKVYIKRGKRIHIFDTVEDADAWVEAEQQATQAIEKAKGKQKVKAKAKVYKALDEQLPHEVIRLDWLESLVAHFNIPVELPTLEAKQDWMEVARIALLAQEMQDEEEVELLLLA